MSSDFCKVRNVLRYLTSVALCLIKIQNQHRMICLKLTMYQILTGNYKEQDRSPAKVIHVTLVFNSFIVNQEGVGEHIIIVTRKLA